ncbi:AMP-binding protein [Magnetospirillum moscoviense]|uniref:Acyl-CoA synthetase n=1 Tax=Magnetospirillum moscoviense TaxID=1437059 RepID=A0A178N0A1_9PROT|nr:AMP-binding protein [Magnetospirillum moscoviense]OAN67309.1 acyl-CoA synthetase [Magnetospirillum moscoviense]
MNAADLILGPALAAGRGDTPALLAGDRVVTYAQLDRLANRFGNALLASGLTRGQPVLFVLDDDVLLVAAYLGAMRAGLVSVALNLRMSAKELAYAIADSGSALLICEAALASIAEEAARQAGTSIRIVLSDLVDSFLGDAGEDLASADLTPDDPCLWMYTSGTTGQPKGAVHRVGAIPVGVRHVVENLGVKPGDKMFATSKLFFAYALGHCLIGGLMAQATLVLHQGWPDAAAAASIIARHRPEVVLSVPALYRLMLREGHALGEAFRAPRCYVSAGEAFPAELCREWSEVTGRPVYEGIGATEALFLFIANRPGLVKPGTTGQPLPWARVMLTNPDGTAFDEPGRAGDLWVKVESLFVGYHNRPDVTARVLVDGWWRTGDVFSVDADGFWSPQGRSDDMIKVSGQWVSPAEIEEVALTVPGIADVAAVGVANAEGLVRLVLYAVAAPGEREPALEARVVETLRSKLAVYKCPRNVRFLEVIPRTATGKVQRFKLRELGM